MKKKDRLQSKIIQAISKPRIIKTGLSVFVTAWLCQLLNWPVIFAVIAAIVSIEPSVHASIQKGKIRLPAAAVGAFFAMLFNFLLGPTPLTYSLSAVLTIYVCHMFRWNHALIVATLTAVNMIETVHGHWFVDFLVRLGTTSIGIAVSTCINFLIFPPKFIHDIVKNSEMLNQNTKKLLNDVLDYQLYRKGKLADLRKSSHNNFKKIENANTLIRFQKDEYRYHRYNKDDLKLIRKCDQQISDLELINHHIADMTFFFNSRYALEQ